MKCDPATPAMWTVAVTGTVSMLLIVGFEIAETNIRNLAVMLVFPVALFMIGLFLWWRAPRHPLARRSLNTVTLIVVIMANEDLHVMTASPPEWTFVRDTVFYFLYGLLIFLLIKLAALLPDGRCWFTYERIALGALWLITQSPLIAFLLGPYGFDDDGELYLLLCGPVLLIARYARLPARQQKALRWLLRLSVLIIGAVAAPLALTSLMRGQDMFTVVELETTTGLLGIALGAAALVVAMVRHRLLGVDLGIRWTTNYGLLWLIFGLWVLAVAGIASTSMGTTLPIVFAVVALAVAYTVRLSRELAARATEVQRQADELAASRTRIVRAQDNERRRIERDLHDGIQQDLVVLVAKLGLTRHQLPSRIDRATTLLTEVQADAYRIIDRLRQLSRGIHPAELSDQGLLAAVRSLARRAPIPVTVGASQPLETTRFGAHIEESAFFLASESLTNILKHAQASHVTIQLSLTGGTLTVEITDDGAGLPEGFREGSGLTGLRDRIGATNGELEVVSSPARGTTVRARLPVEEDADA